jgi:hypothetical protein
MLEELMDDEDELREMNLLSRPRREERRRQRERERLERELERWACIMSLLFATEVMQLHRVVPSYTGMHCASHAKLHPCGLCVLESDGGGK